jgi:hypothetical protein
MHNKLGSPQPGEGEEPPNSDTRTVPKTMVSNERRKEQYIYMSIKKQIENIELGVEWKAAQKATHRLQRMLADEIAYLIEDNKRQNAYSLFAWVRLCRAISTLTSGMACMRLTFEGRNNAEIEAATGLRSNSIAAYKAWNTMYACDAEKMLFPWWWDDERLSRETEFLRSMGVTL